MSRPQLAQRDLSAFDGCDSATRAHLIRERFPSTATLRWGVAFANNPELLGRLLRDILKAERATAGAPGVRGARPDLDPLTDAADVDRLRGLDPSRHPYSSLAFPAAFALLADGRSVRSLSHKVHIGKDRVFRLLKGRSPTMGEMEGIAAAFKKEPSYFLEYRMRSIHTAIIVAMEERVAEHPEENVSYYERLWASAYHHGA